MIHWLSLNKKHISSIPLSSFNQGDGCLQMKQVVFFVTNLLALGYSIKVNAQAENTPLLFSDNTPKLVVYENQNIIYDRSLKAFSEQKTPNYCKLRRYLHEDEKIQTVVNTFGLPIELSQFTVTQNFLGENPPPNPLPSQWQVQISTEPVNSLTNIDGKFISFNVKSEASIEIDHVNEEKNSQCEQEEEKIVEINNNEKEELQQAENTPQLSLSPTIENIDFTNSTDFNGESLIAQIPTLQRDDSSIPIPIPSQNLPNLEETLPTQEIPETQENEIKEEIEDIEEQENNTIENQNQGETTPTDTLEEQKQEQEEETEGDNTDNTDQTEENENNEEEYNGNNEENEDIELPEQVSKI